MRHLPTIALLIGLCGCTTSPPPPTVAAAPSMAAAEQVIDAFYSFDPERLRIALADAPDAQPQILFYQGWAQGGNYGVLERRPCRLLDANSITCSITVRDDLIAALGTGYWVTDTFHMAVKEGRVVDVDTSSDDPPDFGLAMEWVGREQPEIMTGPCQGFFAGGPSPQACVRAMVEGFKAYRAANPLQ